MKAPKPQRLVGGCSVQEPTAYPIAWSSQLMPGCGPACLLNNRAAPKVIVHDLFGDDTTGIRRRSSNSIPIAIASTRWLILGVGRCRGTTAAQRFSFVWVTVPIATVVSRILAISGAFEL